MNPDSQGTFTPGVVTPPPLSSKPPKKRDKKKLIVILILLLLGVAAATAYFFVFSGDKAEAPVASQEQQSSDTDKQAEACADSLSEYKNDDLGVSFCYPSEWGDVSMEPGQEEAAGHLTKGSEKVFIFSGNPTVTAGVVSKDRTHNDTGHDGVSTPGYISMEEAKRAKESIKSSYVYVDTDDQFAYIIDCLEFCSSSPDKIQLSYSVKLKQNDTYELIEFRQDGDAFDETFWDKELGGVSPEKVSAADLTQLFKKTDSRFVVLQRIADDMQ